MSEGGLTVIDVTDHADVDYRLTGEALNQFNSPADSLLFSRGHLDRCGLLNEAENGVEGAIARLGDFQVDLTGVLADYIASQLASPSEAVVLVSIHLTSLLDVALTLVADSRSDEDWLDATAGQFWPHGSPCQIGATSNFQLVSR